MKIRKKRSFVFLFAFLLPVYLMQAQALNENTYKLGRTLGLIDSWYVDTTDINKLTEQMISELLRSLDPHSVYISAKDVKEMNEPLNGNFDGIGIQFNLLRDSIIVIEPIPGGPSEKVGLLPGDRIIMIDGEKVAGTGISTTGVRSRLMGMKGTKVNISIFREGEKSILEFSIIRDKIPINSLDAAYMLNNESGYIRLNKFAATTLDEFDTAVDSLIKFGKMKNLVIDLRGNGGGYMNAATDMADEFYKDKKLLVYLNGRKTPRQDYYSSGNGRLASSRIAVLTDEGSASASEILAGAIQDWDRGIIVGRRTFGKGLVQNGFYLNDGSMIRLTIARYYTPTGRLIQSPYDGGYDKYVESFYNRYTHGEMITADSIHFPDSLKYKTMVNKRTVYGGGGIMPDVFVPADTLGYSDYYRNLIRKGVLNSYSLEYSDKNRKSIGSKYKTFSEFKAGFTFSEKDVQDLKDKAEKAGVKFNEEQYNISKNEILTVLKAYIAANIWETTESYMIINDGDKVIESALRIITDKQAYDKLLGFN